MTKSNLQKILFIVSLSFSHLAFAAYNCSASPVDAPSCKSDDGKYQIDLYDLRANHADFYHGLNEIGFCKTGRLKLNGISTDESGSDFSEVTFVSSENGLKTRLPYDRSLPKIQIVEVTATVDFYFSDSGTKKFNGPGGVFYYFDKSKSAQLYLFDNKSNPLPAIKLKCQ
jgi:hypothetical protein